MAAKNDFFLNFGSNAPTWANDLKSQLAPARNEILEMQALLTSLERQAGKSGGKISRALAEQAGGKKTGGGGTIPGAERLMTNMVAASGELDHILDGLKATVKGLEKLPQKVSRGISGAIEATLRQLEGNGPRHVPGQGAFVSPGTPGSIPAGGPTHTALQNFTNSLNNFHKLPNLLDRASITGTSAAAIDKAGVDRIVNAIKAQTKTLTGAGIRVQGGEIDTVSSSGKKKGGKAKVEDATAEIHNSMEEAASELAALQKQLALIVGAVGDSAGDAVAGIEKRIDDVQARMRKKEREATGKTRDQQSADASAAAKLAKKNQPDITAEALQRNRELTALINSPGASDFDSRLGAARTSAGGNYSRADLDRMVAAYREVGIIVKANSKTTKEELAARLKAANAEYHQIYPEGAEAIRTTGFNVVKKTKVGDETAEMLGGFDVIKKSAKELGRSFDIISADLKGGGKKIQDAARATAESVKPDPGQPKTGNQVLPPAMVKGRKEFGSGLGDLYTEDELYSAVAATRPDASRAMSNVLQQAVRSDFDPYAKKHSDAIEAGSTPEEIRLAQAARNRLRDTRLATEALDQMGQEFFGLKQALDENSTRAGNLRTSILTATKAGQNTKSLEGDYAGVNAEIENIHKRLMQIPRAYRDVFETPGYKEGLSVREGQITDSQAVGAQGFYRTLGTDRTMAQRDDLRAEVAAAEKAISSGQRVVKKLNADAAKGLEIDVDEFTAAMDKIERAETALPRFRHELQLVERLFEETAEGAQKLSHQVAGMGSRQALESRRDMAQNRETLSDYTTLREAVGSTVAGRHTAMGSRDQAQRLPGVSFIDRRFVPTDPQQGWSAKRQEKLDSATHKLTMAQLDYSRAINSSDSTVDEVNEAKDNLSRAANLLANRLASVAKGLAPSFQSLTGFDPPEGKIAEDEARRERARAKDLAVLQGEQRDLAKSLRESRHALDRLTGTTNKNRSSMEKRIGALSPEGQAEARRLQQRVESLDQLSRAKASQVDRQTPKDNAAQAVERASLALSTATKQHAEAQKKAAKAAAALEKEEKELAAAYDKLKPAGKKAFLETDNRLKEVERSRSALNNAFLIEDPAARAGRPANAVDPKNADEARQLADAARRSRIAYQSAYTKALKTGNEDKAAAAELKLAGARQAEKFYKAYADGVKAGAGTIDPETGSYKGGVNALLEQYETNRGGHAPGAKRVVPDILGYPSDLDYAPPIAHTSPGEDLQEAKKRLDDEAESLRNQRNKLIGHDDGAVDAKRADRLAELEILESRRQARSDAIGAAASEGDLKENAGYHAARDAQARDEARIAHLKSKLNETQPGVGGYERLAQEAADANKEVARLAAEVDKAEKALQKNNRALEKRKGALEKERDALTAQGSYKKEDTEDLKGAEFIGAESRRKRIQEIDKELRGLSKALSDGRQKVESATSSKKATGSSAENQAEMASLRQQIADGNKLRAERTRLHQEKKKVTGAERDAINAQINELRQQGIPKSGEMTAMRKRLAQLEREEAGGSGGKGGSGRTAVGGDDGDDNILRRILAKLNEIHSTLKGGVKVTGKVAESGVDAEGNSTISRKGVPINPVSQSFPKAEVKAARGEFGEEAAVKAAAAQERRFLGLSDSQTELAHAQALKINKNLEGERAKAAQRSVLEQARLEAALKLTTRATQDQVAGLISMIKTGASEDDINRQRLRTYQSLEQDLARRGVGAAGRTEAAQTIFQNIEPKVDARQTNAMVGELQKTSRSINGFRTVDQSMAASVHGQGLFDESSQFTQALFGNSGFWSRVMNSTGTFIVRNFTAGFVFGMTAALQQVIDQAIQAEATFVRVSAALEATGKDTGNIRSDLQGIASEYGVQLNDVYTQAAGLAGLFEDAESLAAGTRVAAQLQIISGGAVNAQEAIGILASTLSAFQALPGEDIGDKLLPGGLEGVTHVADVLTSIQNNLGTNVEITAEGVSRLSGLARQMQLSFEQTAVFTAQIAKQTNQTGAAAGEQFSRILAGIQTGRGRAAAGAAFGPGIEQELGAGDYGAAIERMMAGWDGLSDAQRRNLTVSIAGSRQAASFNALMNNGTRTLNALRKAEDANGDAADRMAELVKTLNNQLARLGTNVQVFASNLIQTGVLDFLGLLLTATNETLEAINAILNAFNGFAESNGFLKFMRDAVFLLLGAAAGFKLVQAGITGMKGAMAAATASQAGTAFLGATGEIAARRRGRDENGEFLDPRQRNGLFRQEARVIQINADRVDSSFLNRREVAAPSGGVVGRSSGVIAGTFADLSNRLANAVDDRMKRAEVYRSRYGDQTRFTSLGDDVARTAFRENLLSQGLSETEVGRRTTTPDANLLRSARSLERVGAAGDVAARRTANVASAMDNLSGAGLGADLALGAVLAGVVAFVGGINQQAHDAKIAAESLKDFQLNPQERRAQAEEDARYIGPATEDLAHQREKLMEGGASGWWNRTWGGLQARFSNGLHGFADPAWALEKQYGLEDVPLNSDASFDFRKALEVEGNQTGMDDANDFVERTQQAMQELVESPKATVEQLRRLEHSSMQDLDTMAYIIENDASLTEGERKAAAASLESARARVADMTLSYSGMIDNLAGSVVLTAAQLAEVGELANLAIQTGGRDVVGGLDVGGILADLAHDTGVEGTGIGTALDKMSSGGTDSIDRAQINLKIIRDSIQRLHASWLSKLETDPMGDETIAVRNQLIAAIGQLQQASDQVIQSMYDNAALLGGGAANRGDLPGAIGYYIDALDQADRAYDRQTRAIERSFEAEEALANTVYVNQGRLRNIINQQGGLAALMGGVGVVDGTALLLGGPMALETGRLPELPKGIEYDPNSLAHMGFAPPTPDEAEKKKGERERRAKYDQGASSTFQSLTELLIFQATKHITLQIAQTADAGLKAGLEAQRANIEAAILGGLRTGNTENLPGIDQLAPHHADKLDNLADEYGDFGVSLQALHNAQVTAAGAQVSAAEAQDAAAEEARAEAAEARQQAAALQQARLGVAAAWADARGDAVASAQVQAQIARATMAAAQAELAAASTASETTTARIAILNAQAQIIAANASIQAAQTDLVQSQYDVSIALAEASGNTVLVAVRQLAAARAALKAAMKRSGGKATAEVNAARAEAIRADAAVRDARLQDDLDTIDFNLEMGKITQSSAIAALREILRTQDLTKAQRRQLLLQIKGMKDEMADSQWNFGDIKLPTPYQMRRYIEQRKNDFRGGLESAARSAGASNTGAGGVLRESGSGGGNVDNSVQNITFQVNGADVAQVKRIIREVVGTGTKTRTHGARRR